MFVKVGVFVEIKGKKRHKWKIIHKSTQELSSHVYTRAVKPCLHKSCQAMNWSTVFPIVSALDPITMAEYNDFIEELEKIVTCVICNDILTEPKTLPCLHTFCFVCIQSWYEACKKERKPFKCPSCRTRITVQQGDVINLPTSFQHNTLVQLYNSIKNKTSDQQQLQQCISCSKRCIVVGFCFQCGMLCNDCMNAHKTMNTLKETHQAMLWNEVKKENMNSFVDHKSLCQEKYHQNIRLEYYCQICKKCVCQKCVSTAHKTHDTVSIVEGAAHAKKDIRKEKHRLNEAIKMYKKELELSRENRDRIKNEVDVAKAKLRIDTQVQMKILQDKEDEILASLNDFFVDQTTMNDEEKSEINAVLQQAVKLRNQCQEVDDYNLKQFILEGHEKLEEVCKATVKGASILTTKPARRNSSVHFIPNPESINSVKNIKLGTIVQSMTDPSRCSIESRSQARCGFINHFDIMTKDTNGNVCDTNKALIDVQIQDIDGNDVHREITETQTGKYTVKYKAQKPSPYKVVVRIGGKPIRNSPQNVEIIDAKAEIKPVRVIDTARLCRPQALAVSEKGETAVVENNCRGSSRVVLFSADGEYLREFGGEGTEEKRLNDPLGVSFNADRLLVSDNRGGYGCIKEFEIHGNYIRTICKQKGMRFTRMCTIEQIQSIACLAYKKDSKETFIKLFFKQTGELLQDIKLDICDVGIPLCLAYDNNKYFVSFFKSNSIYVFNENGGLLYTFGEKGKDEGQFNDPRGLAVFGADMILVCDFHNHRVQLLNQGCKFIRSFGSRGTGLGQMNGPVDVVVTPHGEVFVQEWAGKRVQVFR